MLTAKDIMTIDVITVGMGMKVDELAAILWDNKIGGAPVVDANDMVLGVVTESDLIDQTKKIHLPTVVTILDSVIFLENPDRVEDEIKKITGRTVADICARKTVTVLENTALDEIASLMSEKHVHTLPVVDSNNRLVGVIGKSDIIKTLMKK